MKKKVILFIFIGIIIGSIVGIKAATTIQSSQVLYKDKTLDTALNEMYDELYVGKEKLAAAITNKGVETTSDNTLVEMANNIDNISVGKNIETRQKSVKKTYTNKGDSGLITITFDFENEMLGITSMPTVVGSATVSLASIDLETQTVTIRGTSTTSAVYATFSIDAIGY